MKTPKHGPRRYSTAALLLDIERELTSLRSLHEVLENVWGEGEIADIAIMGETIGRAMTRVEALLEDIAGQPFREPPGRQFSTPMTLTLPISNWVEIHAALVDFEHGAEGIEGYELVTTLTRAMNLAVKALDEE